MESGETKLIIEISRRKKYLLHCKTQKEVENNGSMGTLVKSGQIYCEGKNWNFSVNTMFYI